MARHRCRLRPHSARSRRRNTGQQRGRTAQRGMERVPDGFSVPSKMPARRSCALPSGATSTVTPALPGAREVPLSGGSPAPARGSLRGAVDRTPVCCAAPSTRAVPELSIWRPLVRTPKGGSAGAAASTPTRTRRSDRQAAPNADGEDHSGLIATKMRAPCVLVREHLFYGE